MLGETKFVSLILWTISSLEDYQFGHPFLLRILSLLLNNTKPLIVASVFPH